MRPTRREWILLGIIGLFFASLIVQELQVRTCRYRFETLDREVTPPVWMLTQAWTRGCLHEAGKASWTSMVPCAGTEGTARVTESRE